MDNIASLRAHKDFVLLMQHGEDIISKNQYTKAEAIFKNALKKNGNDYACHILIAKCMLLQKKFINALEYAEKAYEIYPSEAQSYHISGMAFINLKKFSEAYNKFVEYDKILPGNPNTIFFKGYTLEKMNSIKKAAFLYIKYIKLSNKGKYVKYALKCLKKWGYIY